MLSFCFSDTIPYDFSAGTNFIVDSTFSDFSDLLVYEFIFFTDSVDSDSFFVTGSPSTITIPLSGGIAALSTLPAGPITATLNIKISDIIFTKTQSNLTFIQTPEPPCDSTITVTLSDTANFGEILPITVDITPPFVDDVILTISHAFGSSDVTLPSGVSPVITSITIPDADFSKFPPDSGKIYGFSSDKNYTISFSATCPNGESVSLADTIILPFSDLPNSDITSISPLNFSITHPSVKNGCDSLIEFTIPLTENLYILQGDTPCVYL